MILAGDVGGTKTALGLFELDAPGDASLRLVREASFPSAEHASLESVVAAFLAEAGNVSLEAACFGVAGVVANGEARATNLPWTVSEAALAKQTGAPRVRLLNDLEATAHGMLFLRPEDLAVLQAGSSAEPRGNVAVIAAGTGLGEALLYWDGSQHHSIATEGGHADFAPRTDLEVALHRHLRELHGRASYEHVLSGPGLRETYRFLRLESGTPEPEWLTQRMAGSNAAAAIAAAALEASDEVCEQTLDLFVSVYGAEAGNLALRTLPRGGLFVGGGIAPKILPALQSGVFVRAFTDKGFFESLLGELRVCVALEPRAALIGSAHFALRHRGA